MHSAPPLSREIVQRGLRITGGLALANSLWMVWTFGAAMSVKHAIALVAVDILASGAFIMAGFMGDNKSARRMANTAGALALFIAFFSHLGYTIGMRTDSLATTQTQTVNANLRAKQVESEAANLDLWRKQLADLTERSGWTANTTAEGLRAKLDAAQRAIDLEATRKPKGMKDGCKSKCLALMQDKAALEEQIAGLEKRDDLSKRIEATQRLLDGKTETAIGTTVESSPVRAQTEFLVQIYNVASGADADAILNPGAVQMGITSIIVGTLIAAASTFSPAVLLWLAFWGATPADATTGAQPARIRADKTPAAMAQRFAPATPAPVQLRPVGVDVLAGMPGIGIVSSRALDRGGLTQRTA